VFAVLAALYLANMTVQDGIFVAQADEEVADEADDDAVAGAPTVNAGEVPEVTEDDHYLGELDAPVVMIEYSDIQCPYCDRHHPTMEQLYEKFDGQVLWVFRHFPLSFHPEGVPAAVASECAGEQGKFFEYTDGLFENQATLGDDLYVELAAELNLNTASFEACLDSGKYETEIAAEMAAGSAAGVTGTPGTFINGQLVKGAVPYESIKQIIQNELAK